MTTWQPPIPAGALYSKPARQLGPALALLAYCYDLVQRDGWLDLRLHTAAGDMEEPYPTIKRWWQSLVDGQFFAEVQSRGRLGMRVRFKDVWLDWRILQARPVETFGTEAVSEVIPNEATKQVSGRNRDVIGTEAVSEVIPKQTVYKEDQHDQKTKDSRIASRAPPTGDHQRLMAAYQEALGYKIPNGAKEATAAKKILTAGYTTEQAIDVYQTLKAGYWQDKHLSLHKVYEEIGALCAAPKAGTNGTYQPNRPPTDRRPPITIRRTRQRLDGG